MQINLAFIASVLARSQSSNKQLDGIGVYTAQLLQQLSTSNQLNLKKIAFHGDTPIDSKADQPYHLTRSNFKLSSALSYATRIDTIGLNRHLSQCDLIHSPDHCIPQTSKIPLVASIMDVIPLTHPEYLTSRLRTFKSQAFKYLARRANHIITISEYSAQQIAQVCKMDQSKITVTYLGVDHRYFEPHTPQQIQDVKAKYAIVKPYFLFVGTLQPRKNVLRLVQAYLKLPASVRQSLNLIIVGRAAQGMEELTQLLQSGVPQDEVKWLKYLPDCDLKPLLQGSTAMVYPSLYEGFGLPIIEAYASAVPVITSQTTSMPEIAGDAALLVDPESTDSIKQAMLSIIDHPAQAQSRVIQGIKRARSFNWQSTASQTIEVYRHALSK
jgi:glycosyltransferase involved in cell wall biosynthesis